MTTLDLDALVLKSGGHSAPSEPTSAPDACVMEAVAYVAGERWSDHPQCASPVLTSFLIGLNDRWSHDDRQLLKPFIPRLVGTRTTSADEETRRLMIVDWLVHEYAPAMFRHAGLAAEADEFESMVPITDWDAWYGVRGRIREVSDTQWTRRREAVKRVAVAAADAVADAVAAADAVAFKAKIEEATAAAVTERKNDESGYSAAYHVLRPYCEERYREVFASVGGLRESVLGLIDRLIEVGRA
jgi:hypothetical protein